MTTQSRQRQRWMGRPFVVGSLNGLKEQKRIERRILGSREFSRVLGFWLMDLLSPLRFPVSQRRQLSTVMLPRVTVTTRKATGDVLFQYFS
jgi:hypothetical protein